MSELRQAMPEELEEITELAPVDGDMEADKLVKAIREAEETKSFWKSYYAEKLKEVNESCDFIIEQNRARLRMYFDSVPHKKTATQEKYPLPSGKLVLKEQEPEYQREDKTIIKFLKENGGEKFVKIKEELDWSGLKKTLMIAGETAADEEGRPIPGIKVKEREKAFTIEK
jgi:phage host-nuclease inhibitor protein Gam